VSGVEFGSVAALVSALVALAALGLTIWQARGARAAATDAAESRRRATEAAAKAADAQTRAADAQSKLAKLAVQSAAKYVPPWRLAHHNGDKYALWNDGDDTEFDVGISGTDVFRGPVPAASVHAHSSLTFFGLHQAKGEPGVAVRWSRSSGGDPEAIWRGVLPPKPPKPPRPSKPPR